VCLQDASESGPCACVTGSSECILDVGQQLVGEDGNEDMRVDANFSGGVFDTRGAFQCSNVVWQITLTDPATGTRHIHVLPSGYIERTNERF